MDPNIRNVTIVLLFLPKTLTFSTQFKDFLQFYNHVSEACFRHCVDNFNARILDEDEGGCVEGCASKFIKYNHKVMGDFVKAQTVIVNKRMEDQPVQNEIAVQSN